MNQNQKISTLMDGELFEDDAHDCVSSIRRNAKAQQEWVVYHLIGDVLRQPDYVIPDVSAAVRMRVENEPTVLAPRGYGKSHRGRSFALAAAATLAAVGVVAWMSLQIGPEVMPQVVAQQTALHPANMRVKSDTNEYLMAHQEFSPTMDMSGGASYIRAVSYGDRGN